MMKGLSMVQWTNLNWNNRSVLVHRYSVFWEKNWPYPSTASGSYESQEGRQADKIQVSLEFFKILYKLNYSGFLFCLILLQGY